MKKLLTRSLSGVVFLIIVIGSILLGSTTFNLLMLAVSLLGLEEYTRLRSKTFYSLFNKILLLISGVFMFVVSYLVLFKIIEPHFLSFIILIFLIIVIVTLLRNEKDAITKISEFILGLVYIVIPFVMMTSFFNTETSTLLPELLIGFFIILWFNDVFAYIVGSLLGKIKLYEKISPKKTWEGTIGGIILSMLSAYFLSLLFLSINLTNWLIIGLLISIFATLGDLTESMFKRQAGVKDSGNIMPGHGGILDRFDGLLLAAPAIYFYLTITH